MKKLCYLSRIDELVQKACDTSFVYWHKLMLPVYFDHIFQTKTEAYRLPVRKVTEKKSSQAKYFFFFEKE